MRGVRAVPAAVGATMALAALLAVLRRGGGMGGLGLADVTALVGAASAVAAACVHRARESGRGVASPWALLALAAVLEVGFRAWWWATSSVGEPLLLPAKPPLLHAA